ncbi:MAG TPA: protein phosphatase 2C domain-containing protein [Caulobacteraceae bacterium]|nr:protein phosphatase 2C domain-containing protein [Caulobacteraceae bacterium]
MSQVSVSRSASFFEAQVSHPGAVRDHNEDAFVARGSEGFWTVADGMGGLADGQFAARTVVEALAEAPLSGDVERDAATVAEVIRHAGYLIFKESTERQNHIGSTAVALLISGGRFATVWAGDSRLYLWRDGQLTQVTRDHTQVQQLVDAGYMSPKEAAEHPMSHVLARAVGVQAEIETDMLVGEAREGDLYLLCSDGLSRVVEDAEIAEELKGANPAEIAERLLALALKREAPDNVTILVVGCGNPALSGLGQRKPPLLGGAGAGPPPEPDAPATPSTPVREARAAERPSAGSTVLVVGLVAFLVVALGVGAWLVGPRLHAAQAKQTLLISPAVARVDRRPFEAALGGVDCSWLEIEKVDGVPSAVELAISGVAASPPAVQGALQAAAAGAKVSVADIDLSSVAPTPATMCPALDALRPFRAPTSITGQNLTAAQESFAVMKQADNKLAGRAVVDASLPAAGDFALVELGADGSMSAFAADRASFAALASAGGQVSKLPDTGGYRLQVDYAKPGWSSLMLVTGQGPFPKALFTQPAGTRDSAWANQFAAAARAGGWKVEMSWYEIVQGGSLSVIPQTEFPNATNLIIPMPKPVAKPPTNAATNKVVFDSEATSNGAANAAAPSAKASKGAAATSGTNAASAPAKGGGKAPPGTNADSNEATAP